MARKRMVHPELFTSESVAALPLTARYTWVGMWTFLDDAGRGKNNASLVKAAVWPLDDEVHASHVRADLDEILSLGMLCAYQCCGSELLHAPAWRDFQKISHATPSRVCPCPVHEPGESLAHLTIIGSGEAPESLASGSGATLHRVVKSSSEKISSRVVAPIPTNFREQYEASRAASTA